MEKVIMMGAILLATLCSAQAQSTNSSTNATPTTDGTTKNSGTGNATNGSATPTGSSNSQGTVDSTSGTSYGMQSTSPGSNTATKSGQRKERKARRNKTN